VARKTEEAFAVWVTGFPASGKSTVSRALVSQLGAHGIDVAVLESDVMRQVLTPVPNYSEEERSVFYSQITWIGTLLARHGVPVIFDATANRRSWRNAARKAIPRFIEVYVRCPLEICMARDPKGIYRRARQAEASSVPGLQTAYEPPETPDVVMNGDREDPESAARRIVAKLREKGYITAGETEDEGERRSKSTTSPSEG
jgi:adenylylsulfate kinase